MPPHPSPIGDTFPVQGKVSCAVLVCRVRSIDYIKPHLINCGIGYCRPSPQGAGRGPVQIIESASLYRAVADGYKAFSLVRYKLVMPNVLHLAMWIEVSPLSIN